MSLIVKTLVTKRAEIAGLINDLERQLARYRADLVHIDSTIALFDPTMVLDAIKPTYPMRLRSGYFAVGEVTRRCREALRDASEPVSAVDIAIRTMIDKGLDPEDRKLRSDFIIRILRALNRMLKKGKVQQIGSGVGSKWALPTDEAKS